MRCFQVAISSADDSFVTLSVFFLLVIFIIYFAIFDCHFLLIPVNPNLRLSTLPQGLPNVAAYALQWSAPPFRNQSTTFSPTTREHFKIKFYHFPNPHTCTTSKATPSTQTSPFPYIPNFHSPIRCNQWQKETRNTPNPYFILRLKLMLEASSKYFVGQVTSPMSNPA